MEVAIRVAPPVSSKHLEPPLSSQCPRLFESLCESCLVYGRCRRCGKHAQARPPQSAVRATVPTAVPVRKGNTFIRPVFSFASFRGLSRLEVVLLSASHQASRRTVADGKILLVCPRLEGCMLNGCLVERGSSFTASRRCLVAAGKSVDAHACAGNKQPRRIPVKFVFHSHTQPPRFFLNSTAGSAKVDDPATNDRPPSTAGRRRRSMARRSGARDCTV